MEIYIKNKFGTAVKLTEEAGAEAYSGGRIEITVHNGIVDLDYWLSEYTKHGTFTECEKSDYDIIVKRAVNEINAAI